MEYNELNFLIQQFFPLGFYLITYVVTNCTYKPSKTTAALYKLMTLKALFSKE